MGPIGEKTPVGNERLPVVALGSFIKGWGQEHL